MLHDATRRYLERSGFSEMQSDALADLHAELRAMMDEFEAKYATKQDLALLEARITSDFRSDISDLRTDLKELEARLTWRFLALTALLGTVLSLVNIFAA